MPVIPGISRLPTFVFQSLMMKRISSLVLVLEGLVGLHRTSQIQLFGISGWSIDLDYCDIEWFALEMNRDQSVGDCTQVLHFILLLTMRPTPSLLRDPCPQ